VYQLQEQTKFYEIPLASLKNLEKQVEVYKDANNTDKAIKVIMFFTDEEQQKTTAILNELGLTGKPFIVVINARADDKPSASKAV